MPILRGGKREWVTASDWDSNGIVDKYAQPGQPDAVDRIVRDYLGLGRHAEGMVGAAVSRLVDANDIVRYGVRWLEQRHPMEG